MKTARFGPRKTQPSSAFIAKKTTKRKSVQQIGQFNVPGLVNCDDALLIVEMQIVRPPYLLNFGKAYLDEQPPYYDDAEIMQAYDEQLRDRWEDRYAEVKSLLWALESQFGIFYADAKPGNISFGDEYDTEF